jgi:hypothetical protein
MNKTLLALLTILSAFSNISQASECVNLSQLNNEVSQAQSQQALKRRSCSRALSNWRSDQTRIQNSQLARRDSYYVDVNHDIWGAGNGYAMGFNCGNASGGQSRLNASDPDVMLARAQAQLRRAENDLRTGRARECQGWLNR